jgi:alpha-D-ribose 1-methylphosphonate 5-triphosphate synthase subunit PhnG
MRVLALSSEGDLEAAWAGIGDKPDYRTLRAPQIGSAMIRGRIGGSGQPFNLGETTMTRAAVQVASDGAQVTGFGHVAGRKPRHAELAALFDAMLQTPTHRARLLDAVIQPLATAIDARAAAQRAAVAPSRVEFFTMVRGA